MPTVLQQAITLAKAGRREEAETLLRQILVRQPHNEVAWIWLSGVVRNREAKREALEMVLAINPHNELAQRGLQRFDSPHPGRSTASLSGRAGTEAATDKATPPSAQPETPDEVDFSSSPLAESFDDRFPSADGAPSAEAAAPEPIQDEVEEPPPFSFELEAAATPSEVTPESNASDESDFSFDFGADFEEDETKAATSPPAAEAAESAFDWDGDAPFSFDQGSETTTPDTSTSDELGTELDFDWSSDSPFDFDLSDLASGQAGSTAPPPDEQSDDFNTRETLPSFLREAAEEAVIPDFLRDEEPPPAAEAEPEAPPFDFEADMSAETEASPFTSDTAFEAETSATEPAVEAESDLIAPDFGAEFDWDATPAFDFNLNTDELAAQAESKPAEAEPFAMDNALEARLNAIGGSEETAAVGTETEAETEEEALDEAQMLARSRQRQQQQQRLLIIATAIIGFVALLICVGSFYVDSVGIYSLIPSLTPAQRTETVPNPNGRGRATVNFQALPADRARIEWTRDDTLDSCAGGQVGLTVEFQPGNSSTISNQLCTGESCVYEKTLDGQPVRTITVNYQCGRDAVITLYRNVGGGGE